MRLPVLLLALLISLAGLASAIHAQSFPSKPVRIIVPFPPGGAADVTSRLLGEQMAKGLAQPVIAENRPGAGAGDRLRARRARRRRRPHAARRLSELRHQSVGQAGA